MKKNPESPESPKPAQAKTRPATAPEPATKPHSGTPHYAAFGDATEGTQKVAAPKPGANPNVPLDEEATTEAKLRATYARDDPRYAGGDVFDLKNEQTTL